MNSSSETLLSALHSRYATKKFDPAFTIAKELRTTLEEALRLTPSSFGLQPWKFVAVENPELRLQLRRASYDQSQITDASLLLVFCRYDHFSKDDIAHFVHSVAQTRRQPYEALNAYRQMMENAIAGQTAEQNAVWMEKQVYIALGNALTTCALLNLDACPIEGLDRSAYDRILDLPARNLRAVVVCPVGKRAQDDPYAQAAKVRHPLSELFLTL